MNKTSKHNVIPCGLYVQRVVVRYIILIVCVLCLCNQNSLHTYQSNTLYGLLIHFYMYMSSEMFARTIELHKECYNSLCFYSHDRSSGVPRGSFETLW